MKISNNYKCAHFDIFRSSFVLFMLRSTLIYSSLDSHCSGYAKDEYANVKMEQDSLQEFPCHPYASNIS